jgi:hypothetical protein
MSQVRDWWTGGRVVGIRHVQAGKFYPIGAKREPLVIGRNAAEADVVLDDVHVGDIHCRIQRSGDGEDVLLEDLQSPNGTEINRAKIKRAKLRDGNLIGVADQAFVVCADPKERKRLAGRFLGRDQRFRAALAKAAQLLEHPPGVLLHDRSGGWDMGMNAQRFAFLVLGPGCPWIQHPGLRIGWMSEGQRWDSEVIEWRASGGVAIVPHLDRYRPEERGPLIGAALRLARAGKLRFLVVAKTIAPELRDFPVVVIPTLEERTDLDFLVDQYEKEIQTRDASKLKIPPKLRKALLRLRSPDDPNTLRRTVEFVHSALREGSVDDAAEECGTHELDKWFRDRRIPIEDFVPRLRSGKRAGRRWSGMGSPS